MYNIYMYDITEQENGLYGIKTFATFDDARAWLEKDLNNALQGETINEWWRITEYGRELHTRGDVAVYGNGVFDETQKAATGITICYIANYDYNSNVILTITYLEN